MFSRVLLACALPVPVLTRMQFATATAASALPYPKLAVAGSVLRLSADSKRMSILLVQRANEPNRGFWALPGGSVNRMCHTTPHHTAHFIHALRCMRMARSHSFAWLI